MKREYLPKSVKSFLPLPLLLLLTTAARADLFEYVNRQEPGYRWEKTQEKEFNNTRMIDLHLVSQVWRGIKWEHRLVVFIPQKIEYPKTAVLLNTGGDAGAIDRMLGAALANSLGCVYATLYQIPNQPLFGNLHEDGLIAYTYEEYLKSGDETWPLLFPMVKSVVKAMDAIQDFARKELSQSIEGFIITGASKRGWTTWLTGVDDPRVKGIMPIVYDNLNIPAQMSHQLTTWGAYSEQIEDYTRRGLQQQLSSERGKRLVTMVDPYFHLDRLTMPKLIINGTNDRYWTLDALNLYWDSLPGPKYILYVPNAGHGVADNVAEGLARVLATTASFSRLVASGQPLPKLTWKHETVAGKARLTVSGEPRPREVRLWTTISPTRDFRAAHWKFTLMSPENDGFTGEIPVPSQGFAALFGEAVLEANGRSFTLSTQVRIVP